MIIDLPNMIQWDNKVLQEYNMRMWLGDLIIKNGIIIKICR